MTFSGKTTGILTGLGIGLAGGLILALLNPVTPRHDITEIAPAPDEAAGFEAGQDTTPALAPGAENGTAGVSSASQIAVVSAAEEAPATDRLVSRRVVAGQVGVMESIDADQTAKVAFVVPQQATGVKVDTTPVGGLQEPTEDPMPDLSTEPAEPFNLLEPGSETSAAIDDPEQPETEASSAIEIPAVDPDTQSETPIQIEPAPIEAAALPELPELPDVPREANTSGTFSTTSSRLPSIGGAGEGSSIVDRNTGDTASGLPSIGATEESVAPQDAAPPAALQGALRRNAVAFEMTGMPLMSIILLDIGADGLAAEELTKLTIPAAFALRADADQSQDRARMFKNAGFEVLALTPRAVDLSLTGLQSPAQVAATLNKIFTLMPDAVGLIDRPSADLQKDRRLAMAVIASFQVSGHGLITYSGGLNPVPREAGLANVPTGSVYRVLDGKGENASVIARYLSRAALDARREGHVIVLGTTAPETVNAILNWALSSNASEVALAPVSASLMQTVE